MYLDYLDKEMTIMGILSVFAVLTLAGIVDKTVGGSSGGFGAELWSSQPLTISLASTALLLAALLFYRQRSVLAFWYGQIAISVTPSRYDEPATTRLIHETDLWSAWRSYFWAFGFLTIAFGSYAAALLAHMLDLTQLASLVGFFVIAIVVVSIWWARQRVFETFDDDYAPWSRWRQTTSAERAQLRRTEKRYWWRSGHPSKPGAR